MTDRPVRPPTLVAKSRLVDALGYEPVDEALLAKAFAHRSWCAENPDHDSNERLEFLGDAILGFVVAEHVFHADRGFDEGTLTDIRKSVVNAVCLAEVATELDLGAHLRLGKGEEQSGGREKASILSDVMEAVIGAVYLDGGMDAARQLVMRVLGTRIAEAIAAGGVNQDHKSRLQERLATVSDETLRYEFEAAGPDHAREFTVTVRAGERELGIGTGRSKKQAEQQAARAALADFDDDPQQPPDGSEGSDDG